LAARDVFFLLKNAKHRVSTGETAETSALPDRNFHPIRRYLAPDLAVGSANGWRCSYTCDTPPHIVDIFYYTLAI
jgi:hypothetical protein